jgi:uncharacterized protein (TIGR00730 family)
MDGDGHGAEAGHLERWGKVSVSAHEHHFLRGPRGRIADSVEVARISWDFLRGFQALHCVGPCVTVFGSARFPEEHRYYRLARATGAALAREGFAVMTGGGPGIMEAANRGAREAGGVSVGVNIELPQEQNPNDYLDLWLTMRYFYVRKVMLIKYSYAFIVMPGGYGTMDEIYDTTTMIQTGKIADFPVIMMGTDFWAPLLAFMRDKMLAEGTIDQLDLDRLLVTDSPEEATACVLRNAIERFGLHWEATAPHPTGMPRRVRRTGASGIPPSR